MCSICHLKKHAKSDPYMGIDGDLSTCLQRLSIKCPFDGFTHGMDRDSSRKFSSALHQWCPLQSSDCFPTAMVASSGTWELGWDFFVGHMKFLT